jgi:hypothetical protein
MRHDDRRGASDRDEADLQVLLLERAGRLGHGFAGGVQRKELRQRSQRGAGADRAQKRASCGVGTEHGLDDGGLGDASGQVVHIAQTDRAVVVRLSDMLPARTTAGQSVARIERIAKC